MSIKLWYGTGNNKGLHGYLEEFGELADVDCHEWCTGKKSPPFGLGVEQQTSKFIIQQDGIDWFCWYSREVQKKVEEWLREYSMSSNLMQSLTEQQKEDLAIILVTYVSYIKSGSLADKPDIQERLKLADNLTYAINYGKLELNYLIPNKQFIEITQEDLICPHCNHNHYDIDEWALKPHKTHLCLNCNMLFEGTIKAVSNPSFEVMNRPDNILYQLK